MPVAAKEIPFMMSMKILITCIKKVIGFTRNTTKSENKNPWDQREFLGQNSHNENKPTTKHLLSFEFMGYGNEYLNPK
jgi:hypothetical protein